MDLECSRSSVQRLAMILYSLGVLLIIRTPQHHMQDAEHWWRRDNLKVWYTNDSAFALTFDCIKVWFTELCSIRLSLGYHPEPDKRFLVTSTENTELATAHFNEKGFKIRTSFRYLGIFLGAAGNTTASIRKSGQLGSVCGNIITYCREGTTGCICRSNLLTPTPVGLHPASN